MNIFKTLSYCLLFVPLLQAEQVKKMEPKSWCQKFSQWQTSPDQLKQQLELVKYLQSKTQEVRIALKENKEIKDIQIFLKTEATSPLNNPETRLSNLIPEKLTENYLSALYDDLLECFLCALRKVAEPLRQK